MTEVKLSDDDSLERALKLFKRKLQKSGLFGELRRRRHYVKPSEARAIKSAAALRRKRKKKVTTDSWSPFPPFGGSKPQLRRLSAPDSCFWGGYGVGLHSCPAGTPTHSAGKQLRDIAQHGPDHQCDDRLGPGPVGPNHNANGRRCAQKGSRNE